MNPMLLVVRSLNLWARGAARVRAAFGPDPEAGALTLEWIVIAGILVVAAVAAGLVFRNDLATWEAKLAGG
jgi:hypothetical protein